MCGAPIEHGKSRKVFADGAYLTVCPACQARLSAKSVKQPQPPPALQASRRPPTLSAGRPQPRPSPRSSPSARATGSEKLELVEDYAERIRRARESLGWDQRTLAIRVKVSENIIKRIESGRLRPPLDLAKRLEDILHIKLLVPAVEEVLGESKSKTDKFVTLGEIVNIRGGEENK